MGVADDCKDHKLDLVICGWRGGGWAVLKIKRGAKASQDCSFFRWPLSDYDNGDQRLTEDMVFIAQKMNSSNGLRWVCYAPHAGFKDQYGNGSVYVMGNDSVELLTPVTLYAPAEDYWEEHYGEHLLRRDTDGVHQD